MSEGMMSSVMVDRVAKAIVRELITPPNIDPHKTYEKVARAAIEAMREPTLAMIAAGAEDIQLDTEKARRVWQAMIDEGLR